MVWYLFSESTHLCIGVHADYLNENLGGTPFGKWPPGWEFIEQILAVEPRNTNTYTILGGTQSCDGDAHLQAEILYRPNTHYKNNLIVFYGILGDFQRLLNCT